MAKSKYIEAFEEQYTKKDTKSVLRYKAPDGKWRYIQTSKDASGGDTPTPTPTPIPSGGMTEVTWQELKDKRDNGELNPGSLYRITDYNCTTTQENTQSAGHQFDIVLLALSANKLAEEGWAMEHPTDVYDVTFSDGVTKKCWIYQDDVSDNVVDYITLLGNSSMTIGEEEDNDVVLDKANRTAVCTSQSSVLHDSDLTYNYFQNSNLSAWKVWYCLDNDKSRFAWADDSVDEGSPASIEVSSLDYERYIEGDKGGKYAWYNSKGDPSVIYTDSEEPIRGDYTYIWFNIGQDFSRRVNDDVTSFIPAHEGTNLPNGRGVIYRLIDEWNNDCPYDFKNIVIYLGGKIEKGYLFSHTDGDIFSDMSLTGIFNDVTIKKTIYDNHCQVIDIGILVADDECCNIIVASGALSEDGANNLASNVIFGYTMV